MSRTYRRKIINNWILLCQCYKECIRAIEKMDRKIILDIIISCQDVAIVIGNSLEKYFGEETQIVSRIGILCENFYECYEKIKGEVVTEEYLNSIQEELRRIGEQLEHDLPDKIEMVFLPYKVSMWDSLESVWKAASECEECETYVVPIPYYSKNEKGELEQEYYEIDQYPDDIPTVHYKKYNLEERCPDIVFIHNPYDEYNRVTTIHPQYYVKELKQYANKVVYIPYYVSNEFNPSDIAVQREKESFIITPGVVYSDYTIVQSENARQMYVNVLRKNYPDVQATTWEKKILGLGSPKIDRVLGFRRDDNSLPIDWKKNIYNADGKRKKVIFYNTSLSDLLNCKNMMDKIEDTLTYFQNNEDCILWWRPHPLYESTLESMMPDQVDRYRKIVETYKDNGIGIFDDGVDLNWAIAETDAYYGDGSSVSVLFQNVKKPVMYQSTKIRNCIKKTASIPMWPCTFYADEDEVWFFHGKINMLCRYDLNTLEYELIGSVPGEDIYQAFLYTGIVRYKDKLVLAPGFARSIAIYDIKANKFEKIELQDEDRVFMNYLFEEAEIWKDYLICYPYNYRFMLKINLGSNEIERINLLGTEIDNNSVTFYSRVRIQNSVFMVCDRTNSIIKINLESGQVTTFESPMNEKYTKVTSFEGNLVLYSPTREKIVLMRENGQEVVLLNHIKDTPFKMNSICGKYILIEKIDGECICIDGNGSIVFNVKKKVGKSDSNLCYGVPLGSHGNRVSDMNTYFDTSNDSLLFYRFDGLKREVCFNDVVLEKIPSNQMLVSENELFALSDWVNIAFPKTKLLHNCESVGKRIADHLISNFVKGD